MSAPTPFTGTSTYGYISNANTYTDPGNGLLHLKADVDKTKDSLTNGLFEWRTTDLDFMLFADLISLGKDSWTGVQVTGSADSSQIFFQLLYDGNRLWLECPSHLVSVIGFEEGKLLNLRHIVMERRGTLFKISVAEQGSAPEQIASISIKQDRPVFLGLLLHPCQQGQTGQAVYGNCSLSIMDNGKQAMMLKSRLNVFNLKTGLYTEKLNEKGLICAAQWANNPQSMYFVKDGALYKTTEGQHNTQKVDTVGIEGLNNDCGFSPNGKLLAMSHHPENAYNDDNSTISILDLDSGKLDPLPIASPSYWHGWSPDSSKIVYTSRRDGNFHIGMFDLAARESHLLTQGNSMNDGAEFAPTASTIYFNSNRSGTMEIWQMDLNGANLKQLTADPFQNWFPHPSKDGKKLVFLSYQADVPADIRPADNMVMLRMMDVETGNIVVLANFFGGRDTLNIPCWSPNGDEIAFFSYGYEAYF